MSGFAAPSAQADWVIIALRHGDRCVLYASRTLTQVELQVHARFESATFEVTSTVRVPTYVEATLEFHDYVTVTGASYRECLVKLFQMGEPGRWSGQTADAVKLDEAQNRLEAARAYSKRRDTGRPRALGPG